VISLFKRLERAAPVNEFNGTINGGRKGIAYDWQALVAAAEAAHLDCELAALTPEYAE
jgi:hypothetical protein